MTYISENTYAQGINQDAVGYQSPPVTTVLDDSNVMFVWSQNAASDDLQGETDASTPSFYETATDVTQSPETSFPQPESLA